MARSKSTPDIPVLDTPRNKAPSLADVLKKERSLVTYAMGVDPVVTIPVDSIGYEVMIQNAGLPVNCISMAIADAHAGKTTHSHVLGNWFSRAGGDVILAEGDGVLDESYIGRFYDFRPQNAEETFNEPLEYFIDALQAKLDSDDAKKGVVVGEGSKKALLAQLKLATDVLDRGQIDPTHRLEQEILFLAQSSFRMRHVLRVEKVVTTEDLEKLVTTVYNRKLETDPTLSRPTLIIVDPISNFIPNELAEQEDSASGRKMGMASYLNQFFRRWSKKLGEAHIHLHLTAKKSTFIQTNMYQRYSELEQLTTVGGGPQRLAAALLFHMEMGRKFPIPGADQDALVADGLGPYQDGHVKVPKKKFQGGYIMPKDFRTQYWLFTERQNTRMDFDLPFMEQVFKNNLFGIRYGNGYVYFAPDLVPSEAEAAKFGAEFVAFCEELRKKPTEKEGLKLRRSDAVKALTKSLAWRAQIHTTLGIGHQDIANS